MKPKPPAPVPATQTETATTQSSTVANTTTETATSTGSTARPASTNNPTAAVGGTEESSGSDDNAVLPIVSFAFYRNIDSPGSVFLERFQGLDYAVVTNHNTGEKVYLTGGQTVSNHSRYPIGNTIQANEGIFKLQYLGVGERQPLFNDFGTTYSGPIFNVINARTEGGSRTDSMGRIIGSTDTTPVRIHSTTRLRGNVERLYSGGCLMFPLEQLQNLQSRFEAWGIRPGALFSAYIDQDFYQ